MRRKMGGMRVIWPQYFDIKRSRGMGRKLSKELAIPTPNIEDMEEAAIKLGYKTVSNNDAHYPRSWWDPAGMILIDTKGQTKQFVMIKMVSEIKKIQDQRKHKKKDSQKRNKRKYKDKDKGKGKNKVKGQKAALMMAKAKEKEKSKGKKKNKK